MGAPAVHPAAEPSEAFAPRAFEALYAACAGDVHSYVASLVRDPATAEDVTAGAFETAYRRRERFDPLRGTQRAWLFAIARNAALDELRRRRRRAPLQHDVVDHDAVDPAEAAEVAARRATVRTALAGLEAADRELVVLKFLAELTNAEIADVLGVSPTAAGSRLHRAVTKLREACA